MNLPVKSVEAARTFFAALGFDFNPAFSDEKALCMVVSDESFVMLLERSFFREFVPSGISNTSSGAEMITCLTVDSREDADRIADAAVSAGGKATGTMDQDGMYSRSFTDIDGHLWEFLYMDESAMPS